MKNLKIFSIFVIGFSLLWGVVSADTQCITLGENRVCVNIRKQGDTYHFSRSVSCHDNDCGVFCDAITETTIFNVGGCNGSFNYDGNGTEMLKINIMVNGIYGQISGRYNFSEGEWVSSSSNSSSNNNNYRYDDDDDDNGNYYNYTLNISANSSSISTSQFAKITIDTDDDYVGRVNLSLKYRSSTSSSWSNISRTNSTYVSDYSSVRSNGYYNMTYSNYGNKVLSNLVKFKKTGYYRIYAEDEDGNTDYVDIHVTSSSSSSSDNYTLNISANSSSISTSQFTKITIDTDDDYAGRVNFSLKYRSSTSSSWSNISRTNSTYVSDYSSVWSNGYYNMTYSNYGNKVLSNLVKFKKTGYYRIYAEDEDGNTDYVDIHVTSSSSSSSDNYTLNISASSSSISASQFVKLYINTDYEYVGRVNLSLKYRSSTSSSWSNISRTNSTYVSDYSSVRSNGYYTMNYYDYGNVAISNLVKFKKTGYYRIYAEDEDGNTDYVDIHVTSSSSSSSDNHTLNISATNSSISTSQFAKITIDTDDDYVGRVNLSLKYRSSTSSSWSNISRTNSTYVSDYSSVWSNGYYNMTYSNYGNKVLSNLVKFKKTGYYRIYAEDEDGNTDYVDIHVTSSSNNYSSVDGFTEKEFEMVQRIYNVLPSLIAQLKVKHPSLKSNSSWNNLTNTFYANTRDVINDVYGREFSTYDEFFSAFKVRYNRTMNLIK